MRKIAILIMTTILLLSILVSCSNTQNGSSKSSSYASNISSTNNTLNKVGKNIYLREGTSKEGSVVISSDDIEGFYTKSDKTKKSYQIIFKLTEVGGKSLLEKTTKLSQSADSASLWIGNENVVTLSVYAPISDGAFAITKTDVDSMNKLCEKLQDTKNLAN